MSGCFSLMDVGICVGDTVTVVVDWEDAAVDPESLFGKDVERPHGLLGDGETGGAIGSHFYTTSRLDCPTAFTQIRTEFIRRLVVYQPVPIAVGGYFMPRSSDAFDECRVSVSDPSKNEEGAVNMRFGKNVKQPIRTCFDTGRQSIPLLSRDDTFKSGDLKIVLHVDC